MFATAPRTFRPRTAGALASIARLCAALTAALLLPLAAHAAFTDDVVKIGIMTDVTGPYADSSGEGSMIAAEMAVDDFGGEVDGHPIKLILGDHKNNPEVAAKLAKEWDESEHIDMINDIPSSAAAIAVQQYTKTHGIVTIINGAGSETLTGKFCSPVGVQWQYNTRALTSAAGDAISSEKDGKTWYVVTVNHAFGRGIYDGLEQAIKPHDGKIIGSSYHSFSEKNFFPIIKKAMDSGAQVIAFGNAGEGLQAAIRDAKELGVTAHGHKLVSVMTLLQDVRAVGNYAAAGMKFVVPYYWNQNKGSREFSKRYKERYGVPPSSDQISVYVSTLHYLKAVEASGDDKGKAVVDKMKALPVNDGITDNGHIRKDGLHIHDINFMEVKQPSQSEGAFDYYKRLKLVPGKVAFGPISPDCPFLNGK